MIILEIGIEMFLFSVGIAPTNLVGTTVQAFIVAAMPEETFNGVERAAVLYQMKPQR